MTFSAYPTKNGKSLGVGGIRHKKLHNCNTACNKVRTEKPLVRKVGTPLDKTPQSVVCVLSAYHIKIDLSI